MAEEKYRTIVENILTALEFEGEEIEEAEENLPQIVKNMRNIIETEPVIVSFAINPATGGVTAVKPNIDINSDTLFMLGDACDSLGKYYSRLARNYSPDIPEDNPMEEDVVMKDKE